MTQLLGLVLLSFAVTSVCMVPFIDLLYSLKKRFEKAALDVKDSETPIHDKLMKTDAAIPSGGGVLIIIILIILSLGYWLFSPSVDKISLKILLFTLISFGLLGLVDDVKLLLTKRSGKFVGLGRGKMFTVQLLLSLAISGMLYFTGGLNNLYISGLGNFIIDSLYIPLAAFVIISFANAYNISDGLDGLSTGLLLICLFSFLYFNIWPARIFLGDAGAFAFGATLAVVGLLTGKILALALIGGMFVIIVLSSLIQIMSKKILQKKLLPIAPIHMYFKYMGWEEPKIVVRFWLAQGLFAIFGLWIALLLK